MILLDTNALIWLERRHPRARPLQRRGQRLFLSPATLLELQVLRETGRVTLADSLDSIAHDDRWVLDEPPSVAWFLNATEIAWTRDPFDRLLAAHAGLRGWQLATADQTALRHLGPRRSLELQIPYFEIGGSFGPAPVIFGEQGDQPLLGATTLESLGLLLDPFKRRLIPMRMVLA